MTCAPHNDSSNACRSSSSSSNDNDTITTTVMLPTKLQTLSKTFDDTEEGTSTVLPARFQVKVPQVLSALTASSSSTGSPVLPAEYQPRPMDVKCGRGKGAYNNPGNILFRQVVEQHMTRYMQLRTVVEKTSLLTAIGDAYQDEHHGRFIRCTGGGSAWIELSREEIRAKVGHAMRQVIAAAQKRGTMSEAAETCCASKPTMNIPNHRQTTIEGAGKMKRLDELIEPDKLKDEVMQPSKEDHVADTTKLTQMQTATNLKGTGRHMSRFEELVAQFVRQQEQQQQVQNTLHANGQALLTEL